ncbi:hypothetical protein HN371_01040 [Candidatus Poribacteria bacterium]|jgi:hypothetical protein|nr:hypothetical protein [Candidatus Poribacteria bacterium]
MREDNDKRDPFVSIDDSPGPKLTPSMTPAEIREHQAILDRREAVSYLKRSTVALEQCAQAFRQVLEDKAETLEIVKSHDEVMQSVLDEVADLREAILPLQEMRTIGDFSPPALSPSQDTWQESPKPSHTPHGRVERVLDTLSNPRRARALTVLLCGCALLAACFGGLLLVVLLNADAALKLLSMCWRFWGR